MAFSANVPQYLPHDPAFPLLVLSKGNESVYSHAQMYIATVFEITKDEKQPRCLTIREWTSCDHVTESKLVLLYTQKANKWKD